MMNQPWLPYYSETWRNFRFSIFDHDHDHEHEIVIDLRVLGSSDTKDHNPVGKSMNAVASPNCASRWRASALTPTVSVA